MQYKTGLLTVVGSPVWYVGIYQLKLLVCCAICDRYDTDHVDAAMANIIAMITAKIMSTVK